VIATQQTMPFALLPVSKKITQQKLSKTVFLLRNFILPSCPFLTIAAVKILL
jgi:hypothetical protein